MFHVFTRTWWAENPAWPNGLEPCIGDKHTQCGGPVSTEEEALAWCKEYNATHDPGRLSLKAEYTET